MRSLMSAVFVVCAVTLSGCAVFQPVQEIGDYFVHSFRPNPHDYRDSTQDEEDEWSFVGREGRGNRAKERTNDPLRKYLMSPKARNIEANLGIGD